MVPSFNVRLQGIDQVPVESLIENLHSIIERTDSFSGFLMGDEGAFVVLRHFEGHWDPTIAAPPADAANDIPDLLGGVAIDEGESFFLWNW